MTAYRLTVARDDSPENPTSWGTFQVYSFSPRHSNFLDPEQAQEKYREELENGTAFLLSYYEHSGCIWSLQNQGYMCDFDSVKAAGILVLLDPETVDLNVLTEVAKGHLRTYTDWCNGEVYGYSLEIETKCDHCGSVQYEEAEAASCWGFYGHDLDYMFQEIRGHLNRGGKADEESPERSEGLAEGDTVTVVGDAKDLADGRLKLDSVKD